MLLLSTQALSWDAFFVSPNATLVYSEVVLNLTGKTAMFLRGGAVRFDSTLPGLAPYAKETSILLPQLGLRRASETIDSWSRALAIARQGSV